MGHAAVDIAVACAALFPALMRLQQLDLLWTSLSLGCLLRPGWWALEAGIAANYAMHGFIWCLPERFAALSKQPPLSTLGSNPVEVFASLEVVAKLIQGVSLLLFLGGSGCTAVWVTVTSAPFWCWAVFLAFLLAGQALNFAMYQAIGKAGVYYGFKMGFTVPWCYGFPFNVGLRHPQYVGVVLTLYGSLTLLACKELAALALPQAVIAWGGMYFVMSAMEQAGDNKSD